MISWDIYFKLELYTNTIFIIGILLIARESNTNVEKKIETDVMDYDGIGNYGRIPDKDPK